MAWTGLRYMISVWDMFEYGLEYEFQDDRFFFLPFLFTAATCASGDIQVEILNRQRDYMELQLRREIWVGIKNVGVGTSLVVQWLRICLPMQGMRVRSLVGELRSHMPRRN